MEENLARFQAMKNGEIPEGKAILRARIDMASSNMNMRDPVLYRIMFAEHHNTGSSWCIYPMYDFAHPLEDAYEHRWNLKTPAPSMTGSLKTAPSRHARARRNSPA